MVQHTTGTMERGEIPPCWLFESLKHCWSASQHSDGPCSKARAASLRLDVQRTASEGEKEREERKEAGRAGEEKRQSASDDDRHDANALLVQLILHG